MFKPGDQVFLRGYPDVKKTVRSVYKNSGGQECFKDDSDTGWVSECYERVYGKSIAESMYQGIYDHLMRMDGPKKQPTNFKVVRYEDTKTMAKIIDQNDPNIPVKKHDDIRCTCCGKKSPRRTTKAVYTPGNLMRLEKHDLPDLTGWAVMEFPFKDIYKDIHTEGTYTPTNMKEKDKICPDCGQKVKAFMNHLKTPMYNPDIE